MTIEIAEENFFDFKCPYCRGLNSFPLDSVGLVRECANCVEALIVPEAGSEMGKKIPLPITTPRLVLRRLGADDWKDLLEFMADEELLRYANLRTLDEQEVLDWLGRDRLVRLTTPDQAFCLGIEVQAGGKLIGWLSFAFTDEQRLQAGLNLCLSRGYQHQGFAMEALDALVAFCFEVLKLHRVNASCDRRNTAACRLFEKAGMRREGESLKNNFVNGEWVDTVWFAMLDEEFGQRASVPPLERPA